MLLYPQEVAHVDVASLMRNYLSYGAAVEGIISEASHHPQSMFYVYPLGHSDSNLYDLKQSVLDPVYRDFISQYETVVIVAFGTTYEPQTDLLMSLAEASKHDKQKIGFIVSLKPSWDGTKKFI